MTVLPRASGTVVLLPVPVALTTGVLRSAESRLALLALWSMPLVEASAAVGDAVMDGATFETETEIYATETVNVIFATIAMHPHFAATWTGTGAAASATLILETLLGWALVEGARAHPRATSEI